VPPAWNLGQTALGGGHPAKPFAAHREVRVMKLGRNDPCHCGSGAKYKNCHAAADTEKSFAELAARNAEIAAAREAALAEAAAKEAAGEVKDGAPADASARAKWARRSTPHPTKRARLDV
jgi:hypothetical protein